MGVTYETVGSFYMVPTMTDFRGLLALEPHDYDELLARGIMNEGVDVVVKRAEHGSEYGEIVPEYKMRCGLYSIDLDGCAPKPQLDFEGVCVNEMISRGFRDLDKVKVVVEQLPYKTYREANYDNFKLDIDV